MAGRFQLLDYAYAHRGLWRAGAPPENSLEAILAAAEAGHGCELDVRPAACGTPVVFHDPQLTRMTGQPGAVGSHTAKELTRLELNGGGTLPTLEQALEAWPGRTPLLIELKIDGETDGPSFARRVSDLVAGHSGPVALMSFSPLAVNAVPEGLMRGALIMPSMLSGELTLDALINTAATSLKPDYLACHVTDAQAASALATDHGLPVAIWTVSSQDMAAHLDPLPVAHIFEGYDPDFARPGR